MLRIELLQAGYGQSEVLHDVSLAVNPSEIVALLGSNGAGKSTIMKVVSGLLRPRGGVVEFDGHKLNGMSPHAITRRGIAHVPEGRRIFSSLTVRENLCAGAAFLMPRREIARRLDEMYAQFPLLRARLEQLGGTLSGGEQQQLAIARGMMARPRCLLLDEPSLGLSPIMVTEVFEMIRQIGTGGTPVLIAEQNVFAALEVAQRGYVLELGSIKMSDSSSSILNDARVRQAYLGL